jgi:hypothetical protein
MACIALQNLTGDFGDAGPTVATRRRDGRSVAPWERMDATELQLKVQNSETYREATWPLCADVLPQLG